MRPVLPASSISPQTTTRFVDLAVDATFSTEPPVATAAAIRHDVVDSHTSDALRSQEIDFWMEFAVMAESAQPGMSPPSAREAEIAAAHETIRLETQAVEALHQRVASGIPPVVELIAASAGRVVCSGLGKSGHIAGKLAATLSSTGTPASFIHAAEALHGDSGGLLPDDVLIAFSASGSTAEVCQFATMAVSQGTPVVAMVGKGDSTLGRLASAVLDVGVDQEADPLELAPTSSTTAALAMGDALAAALMIRREFSAEQFARYHPGGALGQRLTRDTGVTA